MIIYLLKSSLYLVLSFGFYKVWLENEQMHQFKRFYLLGSLLISIFMPLLSVDIRLNEVPLAKHVLPAYTTDYALVFANARPAMQASPNEYLSWIGFVLYGVVTAMLLARFIRNLSVLARQISTHPRRPFLGATVVELSENGSPYTFLNYLFVSAEACKWGDIEPELFTHELTHIRQRHSFDVLFIELLLCFGWFNPLLIWFKRAIQLNHEFMADEAVNKTHQNVTHYQQLLLSKLTSAGQISLTSTLTFQTTKQRLLMMTKHTKPVRVWLAGGCATLLSGMFILLAGVTTTAQVPTPSVTKNSPDQPLPTTDTAKMEQLYGDKFVILPSLNKLQKATRRKFSDLSASEKQRVEVIPPLPQLLPTDAQLNEWKNSKKYGIWIDDKRVSNSQLTNYSAQNFGSYFSSKLEKNAINYGKHYVQIDLMTKPYYQRYVKKAKESPTLVLMNRKPVNR